MICYTHVHIRVRSGAVFLFPHFVKKTFVIDLLLLCMIPAVLTKIDMWKAKGLRYNELNQAILEESHRLFGDADTSTKDWISHHILRLAYSQDEALRRWFISTESALFELRITSCDEADVRVRVNANDLTLFQMILTHVYAA